MADPGKPTKPFISYIWNSQEQKLCGRTGTSWSLIGAFYLCLYVALTAWFVVCLILFFETLDNTVPKWFGEQSLTQDNPGLALRPIPQYDSTLIRFQQGKPSTYKPYTDHLEAFLLTYQEGIQVGRHIRQCGIDTRDKTDEDACRIDLDNVLGDCTKERDFGYEEGEPCVLLKMNRVFGFKPVPYVSVKELMEDNGLTSPLRFLSFTPNKTVGVSCEGANPADRENIMNDGIKFWPNPAHEKARYGGIPAINFPFRNQEGYRSPFLMMKFKKFTKRVIIQVVCKLYAKNIDNSGSARRHGTVRFELLKD